MEIFGGSCDWTNERAVHPILAAVSSRRGIVRRTDFLLMGFTFVLLKRKEIWA